MTVSHLDPARTYALIVGIEQYTLGVPLPGPANDALRFAQWLRGNGVPYENMMLLLSPLPRNEALYRAWPGPYKNSATRDRVSYAVYQWLRKRSGDLLYVFWGGHGMMTTDRKRRLFYADTTRDDWHHLVFESLRVHLLSDFLQGFRRQILIVDACAYYRSEFTNARFGAGDTFPTGEPARDREQDVFFASQEGEAAKNLSHEQSGLFSKILQEELDKVTGSSWPPNMHQVAERICDRFAQDEKQRQHPVCSLQYQPSRGIGVEYSSPSAPPKTYGPLSEDVVYKIHFGELLRTIHLRTRLPRKKFAKVVGVNKNILRDWERGVYPPREDHLLKVIEVCLLSGVFPPGKEREEIQELWIAARAAGAPISRALDETWFRELMRRRHRDSSSQAAAAPGDIIPHFINEMTSAIESQRTRTAVERFLIEYLGTPNRPVPFGGRDGTIDFLDNWLESRELPHYLFVASSAGRGKSALLTRWSLHITQQEDVTVIFIPVSIRFTTNLEKTVFSLLGMKLAALYHEDPPKPSEASMEDWYASVADYLNRPLPDKRRLVIVIDGLDEAADWEIGPDLFPYRLPSTTRIVLSARTTLDHQNAEAWLQKMGLEDPTAAVPLNLKPLAPAGVEDILHKANLVPQSQEALDLLVRELYRLSEGEPLLIKLYVDELLPHGRRPARLLPENLPSIRKGLDGYFERWWKEQNDLWGEKMPVQEPVFWAIFHMLACAKGPLSHEDVKRLLPPELTERRVALKGALRHMKRLVIGDGREQGYSFSHPLLADYFYRQQMDQVDREAVESRILRWGAQTLTALNSGTLAPEGVPPYLVQYYGPHLEGMGADTPTLSGLVSNGWRKAWEAFEGLYSGFLRDVERAWKSAEKADRTALQKGGKAPYLHIEVTCALCQANTHSLLRRLHTTLLVEGVKNEVFPLAQGLAYATQLPHPDQRVRALLALAFLAPEPQKQELLQDVLAMLHWVEDGGVRAELLTHIGPSLSGHQVWEALGMARQLESPAHRLEAISQLIPHIEEPARSRVIGDLYELSRNIHYNAMQKVKPSLARGLAQLALYLETEHKQNAWSVVLQETSAIKDEYQRAKVLMHLAPVAEAPFFQEVLNCSDQLHNANMKAWVFAHLARYAPEPWKEHVVERFVQMLTAGNVDRDEFLFEALSVCLPAVQKQKQLEQIRQSIDSIQDPKRRAHMLIQLANMPLIPDKDEVVHQALQKARSIKDKRDKVQVLGELLPHFTDIERERVEQEAIQIANDIQNQQEQAEALIFLAKHLSGTVKDLMVQRILAVLHRFEDERHQVLLLATLASLSRREHVREKVLQSTEGIIRNIPGVRLRTRILAEFAVFLPERRRHAPIQEIFDVATTVADDQYRLQIIESLAPSLPKEFFQQGLQLAQRIKKERFQIQALATLIGNLPSPQCGTLALDLALIGRLKEINDELFRESIIRLLAPCRHEVIQQEILHMCQAMADARHKTRALTAVLPFLPSSLQASVAREALAALKAIREDQRDERFLVHHLKELAPFEESVPLMQEAETQAKTITSLVEILPSLSEEKRLPIINRFFEGIGWIDRRTCKEMLIMLLPLISSLPAASLHTLWRKLLRSRANHPQQDLLDTLTAFASAVPLLGGEDAIESVSTVLLQLSTQWP
jgi:hypothetical protein